MTTPPRESRPHAATAPPFNARRALPLSNDLVFKTLFSRQLHLLTDLINAVRYRYPPIQVVQVRNPNILPSDVSSKQIILDILAQDTQGSLFNVEMQLRHYPQWPQRSLFYLTRMLSDQLNTGQEYQALKPAVSISLLGHDLYPDYPAQADWHFTLRDARHPAVQLGQAMQVHIIELTKAETLHAFPPALTAWITCLRHNQEETLMNPIEYAPVREAMQHLEDMYTERDLRLIAVRREMAVADYWLGLEDARQKGHEAGHAAGLRAALQRMLNHKFGTIEPDSMQHLENASATQLEQWTERLLDANSQAEVFH